MEHMWSKLYVNPILFADLVSNSAKHVKIDKFHQGALMSALALTGYFVFVLETLTDAKIHKYQAILYLYLYYYFSGLTDK
jgi:hypothetical protein